MTIKYITFKSFLKVKNTFKYFWLSIHQYKLNNKEKFFEYSDLFFRNPLGIRNKKIVKAHKQMFGLLTELVNYFQGNEINREIITNYIEITQNTVLEEICEEILAKKGE